MSGNQLLKEYQKVNPEIQKLYIVPLIDPKFKDTNYLYLLYKDLLEESSHIKIKSLSVFAHPLFFLERLFNKKILLHYHWFEAADMQSLAGMIWKTFWLSLYKLTGGKLVWTVHNKYPHTNTFKAVNKFARKYLAYLSDKIHVHCNEALNIMPKILSADKSKFFIFPHPEFPSAFIDRDDAIQFINKKYELNIDKYHKLFLMLGYIADYKGILEVAEQFHDLDPAKKLLIVGGVKRRDKNYYRQLKEIADNNPNVFIVGEKISDLFIPYFLNAADFMVFNYKDILTSGSVHLALSYNKIIITSAIGCLKELTGENIIFFDDRIPLPDTIKKL